jgi:hypothetical protein
VTLGKPLQLGEGGSPLALTLVIFAAKGALTHGALEILDRPHRVHESVEFIKVNGNHLDVSFGEETFTRTL